MNKHKIGDIIELAYWMTGEETVQELDEFGQAAQMALRSFVEEEHVMLSTAHATTLRPGDARCPVPPEHIHGADVQLLLVEAKVILELPGPKPSRFADELEKSDFDTLARINQKAYTERYPRHPLLTDAEHRTIINDLGEKAALAALRGEITDTTVYIQ